MTYDKFKLKQDLKHTRIFKNDILFLECKRETNWYGKITRKIYHKEKLILKATQLADFFHVFRRFNIEENFLSKDITFLKRTNKLKVDNDLFEKLNYGFFFSHSYDVYLNDIRFCNCKYESNFFSFSMITKYEIEFFNENELNFYALIYICLINPEISVD